tara:strand:+ start:54806 stop:55243 length:438 start_codon:yes stop_codon:yes gene_type:complete
MTQDDTHPEQIIIQAQQQIQGQVQLVQVQQPQVVYIDLKYSPENNLRYWSYAVIGLGLLIYFASVFPGGAIDNNGLGVIIGNSICCLSFSIAFFLDAAFYKGKSDWQTSTGQSNTGSTVGLVFDVIFGIIALVWAMYILVYFLVL